ncbi:MAG: hypothetical protein NW241_01720 [Bacteroidia bacterium]|nr:hypothetical protein [Bacteroidia bacterium]
MTFTIEILHSRALDLLRALESLHMIRLSSGTASAAGEDGKPARTFEAIALDTRGFRFNREEAHER